MPTSEDEQALSMLTHAPLRPKEYEILPAATLAALPVKKVETFER